MKMNAQMTIFEGSKVHQLIKQVIYDEYNVMLGGVFRCTFSFAGDYKSVKRFSFETLPSDNQQKNE